MYKLILVTFGLLGLSFYQLSGGKNYQPRDFSAGAHAVLKGGGDIRVTRLAMLDNTSVAPVAEHAKTETQRLQEEVLAAIRTTTEDPAGNFAIRRIALRTPREKFAIAAKAEVDVVAAPPKPVAAPKKVEAVDLRFVSGSRVNLRGGPGTSHAVLTQLGDGTSVHVIRDIGGWVQLEVVGQGQVGWIADWLLTADG